VTSCHRYLCGFVANTDPSSERGTHWVTFYFPSEEKGEFFDSYGHAPEYYRKSFGDFLKSRAWDFKRRKLQSAWSDVCGQYCIFYLSHRARGLNMSKIVHLFNNDTVSNGGVQIRSDSFRFRNKNIHCGSDQIDKVVL
jgi:hypothetical protein